MMLQAAKAGNLWKVWRAIVLATLPLTALLVLFTMVSAQSGPSVRLSAEKLNLGVGNEVTVDILVNDVPMVYGADVRLSFDPEQLEVLDADADTPWTQVEPGSFMNPVETFTLKNQADNGIGTIDYALTLLHPAPAAQGDGILARVTFRAKVNGWTSISIDQAQFGTQTGGTVFPLPIPVQAGFIAMPSSGVAPMAVTFTDTSTSNAMTHLWDFGDGITGTVENPTHTYTNTGLYYATLTVADENGRQSTALQIMTILNVAPQVEAGPDRVTGEGQTITITGTLFDPDPGDTHTVTINWGDGSVTSGTTGGDDTVSGSHSYVDEGQYSVEIEVCDTFGSCGSDTLTIDVANASPYVGPISAPVVPLLANSTITASATFTDLGIRDTHTAIWDWDDGSTSLGVVTETNGSGTVSASHTYTMPGVYTIHLTVIDDGNDAGDATFQYIVIYDPDGGFVTGSGWFTSPQGAYVSDPLLTGKGHFGFVIRYEQGATTPSGWARFNLKIGDFEFRADDYDWLVIFGARSWFQGSGEINDVDGYKFLITAIDGDVDAEDDVEEDRFRIKIWYEDNGSEVIVYDNGFGSTDFSEDWATELGGGSIVIHYGQ